MLSVLTFAALCSFSAGCADAPGALSGIPEPRDNSRGVQIRDAAQLTGVRLAVMRLTGVGGQALISNAIPFPPGMLREEDLDRVQLFVAGNEQPIYIEALEGRHSDGSLRSALVQFEHAMSRIVLAGELRIGQSRTVPDRPRKDITYDLQNPLPEAVALPADPAYLTRTRVVGPAVSVSEARTFSPTWVQRWTKTGDAKWAVHESDFKSVGLGWVLVRNFYDRSLANFAYWVMSGDPEYFKRGILYAIAYRERYHRKYDYSVQPHETQIEGEALLYTLLGDEESRRGAQLNAEFMRDLWLPKLVDPTWKYTANRPMARAIEAFLAARMVGAAGDWEGTLRTTLDAFLSQQSADGAYRYPAQCDASNNFQTGLFNDALIRYWEEFEEDARILSALKRSADWLWNTQWLAAGGGFKYSETVCTLPNAGATVAAAPDLNLLIVTTFGFVYQQTGDPRYLQQGDIVFQEGIKRAWFGNTATQADKQFNQQFRSAFRYFAYRR